MPGPKKTKLSKTYQTFVEDQLSNQKPVKLADSAQESWDAEPDFSFKIKLHGNSGVGKSSLILRFADETYTDSYMSTIGVDFKIKRLQTNNKTVKMQVWDSCGQERYCNADTALQRGVQLHIVVFDLTDKVSFIEAKDYIDSIRKYSSEGTPIMLVGTKSDLCRKRNVYANEAVELMEKMDLNGYYETSAKENENVEELFQEIAETLVDKNSKKSMNNNQNQSPKQPTIQERLEDYIKLRQNEFQESNGKQHHFWGRFFSCIKNLDDISAESKISAARKVVDKLNGLETKPFTESEIETLNDSRLGRIIKSHNFSDDFFAIQAVSSTANTK